VPARPSEYPTAIRSSIVCDESKCRPMSGSATLATERFRLATPATRISAASTIPARAGAAWVASRDMRAIVFAARRRRIIRSE
jgi:hypothetical protein